MSSVPTKARNRFGVDVNRYLGAEQPIIYRRGVDMLRH